MPGRSRRARRRERRPQPLLYLRLTDERDVRFETVHPPEELQERVLNSLLERRIHARIVAVRCGFVEVAHDVDRDASVAHGMPYRLLRYAVMLARLPDVS